jgi:hypothetical protein
MHTDKKFCFIRVHPWLIFQRFLRLPEILLGIEAGLIPEPPVAPRAVLPRLGGRRTFLPPLVVEAVDDAGVA